MRILTLNDVKNSSIAKGPMTKCGETSSRRGYRPHPHYGMCRVGCKAKGLEFGFVLGGRAKRKREWDRCAWMMRVIGFIYSKHIKQARDFQNHLLHRPRCRCQTRWQYHPHHQRVAQTESQQRPHSLESEAQPLSRRYRHVVLQT